MLYKIWYDSWKNTALSNPRLLICYINPGISPIEESLVNDEVLWKLQKKGFSRQFMTVERIKK